MGQRLMVGKERVKEIRGWGGKYLVGDQGHVYSRGCELSLIDGRYVNLSWKGVAERVDVSYLVARAFLSNLEGRPYVVHKDGDKRNCRVENLCWSEVKEPRHPMGGRSRAVEQYSLNGEYLGIYESVTDAARRTGLARYLIKRCADGEGRRVKQYVFRYA